MQDVKFANLIAELSNGRHRTWLTGSENALTTEVHRSLAVHAMFGHLFYLSDRFMLTNPAALTLMLDEQSLLREMLSTNFAQIVTIAHSRQEFISQAEKIEKLSGCKDITDCWRNIAKNKWEVAVRMPRSRLAIGFEDRTKYNQQDDPRVVEFKKYSSDVFGALIGDTDLSRSSTHLKLQKLAISNQIAKYKSNRVAYFLNGNFEPKETLGATSVVKLTNLFSQEHSEIMFLSHPIIAVCPKILQSNLSVFKSIAKPDDRSGKQAKTEYSRLVKEVIDRDGFAGNSLIAEEINRHTGAFLNVFESLSEIVKLPECAKCNWDLIYLRDILPSVVSAAGI